MPSASTSSEFRVVKDRVGAMLTLSNGQTRHGWFFVAGGSARHAGGELVGDILNSPDGFFPFEVEETRGPRTLLVNRAHVVTAALPNNEAERDPGYSVATRRVVSALLSSGQRVVGAVRVSGPDAHHRLSDWTREAESFRYIETSEATLIVNVAHIIEVSEVDEHE